MNKRIYIADDEKNIRELLISFLVSDGYEVKGFEDGENLIKEFEKVPADLIIMDIMMPGKDGLECCKQIREKSNVPIIMLTARDSELDYIQGITFGSDDYLTKPFRPTVLLMKVKSLLRRMEMNDYSDCLDSEFNDIVYNSKTNAFICNNKKIDMTQTELRFLRYMLLNPEKTYSREELLNKVWGYETIVETRVTDETVRKIRKKLAEIKSSTTIETVWGFGYRLSKNKE